MLPGLPRRERACVNQDLEDQNHFTININISLTDHNHLYIMALQNLGPKIILHRVFFSQDRPINSDQIIQFVFF